eukprot:539017-Amphidinium_carterae.1
MPEAALLMLPISVFDNGNDLSPKLSESDKKEKKEKKDTACTMRNTLIQSGIGNDCSVLVRHACKNARKPCCGINVCAPEFLIACKELKICQEKKEKKDKSEKRPEDDGSAEASKEIET